MQLEQDWHMLLTMGSNSFGNLFRITTWGESHGKAIGVVIDGCPPGIALVEEDLNRALRRRSPGKSPYTSPRNESDHAEILSGVFEGKTTGTPISIIIPNRGADSKPYDELKSVLRPGHANFTYLEKYGCFDYRGGGRASARETACRVAAGAIAQKVLEQKGIKVGAYLFQVADIQIEKICGPITQETLFCPDPVAQIAIQEKIAAVKEAGDSVGGVVQFFANGVPIGLGEPIYDKIEANLAKAMLSIPASKGFEMGSCQSIGSKNNDRFIEIDGKVRTETNHAGGTLGGITTGMPIEGKVTFKPPSSIQMDQKTLSITHQEIAFSLPEGAKHDPCVAIRAVPVVEAMVALVLVDALMVARRYGTC